MTATNHFVARFKAQYCNATCNTQVLDEPMFPHAALPTVADVCAIKNAFRVGLIKATQRADGRFIRITYTLCDMIGIPVAELVHSGSTWSFKLTNSVEIKNRGSDRAEISSTKPQYIIKTIKKNYNVWGGLMPKPLNFMSEIGACGDTVIEALINGSHISRTASLSVDTVIAIMQALEAGRGLNTISTEHQNNLRASYDHSQRNVELRENIASTFKANILDKEFYAVATLKETGFLMVTKVKAAASITDRHKFADATFALRFTHTHAIQVFRSFDHFKEVMPQLAGDIDFQAEMMRQALRSIEIVNDPKDKLLNMVGSDKYVAELNIMRKAMTHHNFLDGTLTLMEVA
jgi:hypothetical protein